MITIMAKKITQEMLAEDLLFPLWRCLDESHKERYKRDIWEQFENNVRSAAYTSKLKTFLHNFKTKVPIVLQAQYSKRILSVVESGQDKEIINWLRTETTYLCLNVRIMNQSRKESFETLEDTEIIGDDFFNETNI